MNRPREQEQDGFLLVSVYMMVAVFVVLGGVLMAYALTDIRSSQRSQANLQAYYLAEAGIDQGIALLRQNFAWTTGFNSVSQGSTGNYSVLVQAIDANQRLLTVTGNSTLFATPVQKQLEVIVRQQIPEGFFDNVIWVAADLVFNGNAYVVDGDVIHGDTTPTTNTGGVTGTMTYDPAANPLPRLDFQQLLGIAQSQGNVYDAARLSGGPGVFPSSFWFTPPTDPENPATGVPNVNYITTDLVLNGNIGTIGGFFVVVGDVITDPTASQNTTINGNGQVAGAIYSTGNFRVNGGGNGLNIDGAVWSGNQARLNGKATLRYNGGYMSAIENLDLEADVQVVSWRDLS